MGKKRIFVIKNVCAFLLCSLSLFAINAYAAKGLDVVMIVDSSGSMAFTDAHRLRIQAAKMFVSLMDQQDRVAVIRFSGRAQAVSALLPLSNKKNKQLLLNNIERISSKGAHTNIHDGLQKGYEILKQNKRAGRKQMIILMSDGKMDVGKAERDLQLTERMIGRLAPKLAKEHIQVHSIAFSDTSNIPLLELASRDTKGFFNLLNGASGIHEIFETIFERTKRPNQIPVSWDDSFVVDDKVRQLTVVVSKFKSSSKVALEMPNGDKLFAKDHHPDMTWVSAKQFDLITIDNPMSGYWLVKFSEGGNKAYILTDLDLRVEASQEVFLGSEFSLHSWLEDKGKPVKNKAVRNSTKYTLHVEQPNGNKSKHEMEWTNKAKGIQGLTMAFDKPGTYKLTVQARNDAFDRSKSIFIVAKAMENIDPFAVLDAGANVDAKENDGKQQTQTAESSTDKKQTDKQTTHATDKENKQASENDLIAQANQLVSKVSSALSGEEKSLAKDKEQALTDEKNQAEHGEEETEAGASQWALLVFLLLNIFAGIAAGGFFLYKRFKRDHKQKANDKTSTETPDATMDADQAAPETGADDEDDTDMINSEPETTDFGDDSQIESDFDDIDITAIDEDGAMEEEFGPD